MGQTVRRVGDAGRSGGRAVRCGADERPAAAGLRGFHPVVATWFARRFPGVQSGAAVDRRRGRPCPGLAGVTRLAAGAAHMCAASPAARFCAGAAMAWASRGSGPPPPGWRTPSGRLAGRAQRGPSTRPPRSMPCGRRCRRSRPRDRARPAPGSPAGRCPPHPTGDRPVHTVDAAGQAGGETGPNAASGAISVRSWRRGGLLLPRRCQCLRDRIPQCGNTCTAPAIRADLDPTDVTMTSISET
jgi:hypothetical protein